MLNRDSLPAASRPSIRRAGAEELLRLWRGRSDGNTPPTAVFFADHIRHENAEFWALERSGELIGGRGQSSAVSPARLFRNDQGVPPGPLLYGRGDAPPGLSLLSAAVQNAVMPAPPAKRTDAPAGLSRRFVPERQTIENRSLTAPGSAQVRDLFLYTAAGARRVIGGPAASRSAPGAAFTGF